MDCGYLLICFSLMQYGTDQNQLAPISLYTLFLSLRSWVFDWIDVVSYLFAIMLYILIKIIK